MKKYIFIFFTLISMTLHAQSWETVEGSYTYHISRHESMAEAERRAVMCARIEALRAHYGGSIHASQFLHDVENGSNTESSLTSYSMDEVRGEWLEDVETPQISKTLDENGEVAVTAFVRFKARAKKGAKTDLSVKTLRNGADVRFESTVFVEDDDFYLYFRTPKSGYIAVYLLDEQASMAYCLLPYSRDSDGMVQVNSNVDYFFFSSPKADASNARIVDELTMTCAEEVEYNQIYVLFSPNLFSKAMDDRSSETLPRELALGNFMKWKANLQGHDDEMEISLIPILIRKK